MLCTTAMSGTPASSASPWRDAPCSRPPPPPAPSPKTPEFTHSPAIVARSNCIVGTPVPLSSAAASKGVTPIFLLGDTVVQVGMDTVPASEILAAQPDPTGLRPLPGLDHPTLISVKDL